MSATTTGTLRIGVIGVGRIGRMHAELLARQVPGAAVTRRLRRARADSARAVADRSASPRVGRVEELLGAPDVDAVAICTSTDTHADLIVAAAQAGKAIFCEKPVSLDLAEVDRALAAVEAAGVPFQIGFNRRFDPAHAAVAAAVADGEVGEPQLVRITSRDPGAAADGVRARLGRDLPRHDDPRLRHGALRRRAARSSRSTRAARCAIDPGFARGRRRRHRGDRRSSTRTAA